MVKIMKKKKMVIITRAFKAILCVVLLLTNFSGQTWVKASNTPEKIEKLKEKKKIEKIKTDVRKNIDNLSRKDKKKVDKVFTLVHKGNSVTDSALELMDLDDDAFYVGTDKILDYYYENDDMDSLRNFQSLIDIDGRADELIEQYADAKEERDSADTLEYATESVIACCDGDIPNDVIDEIAEDQNAEYEILQEKYPVSDSLPVEKQLKIKRALEKADTKIVIFDTTNRQTVAQAIEDYSEYDVFDEVEKSYKAEVEGYTNDTYSNSQQPFFDMINANGAWKQFENYNNFAQVTVAVIDTGLRYTHEDIRGRYTADSYDVINDCWLTQSNQPYNGAHGTAMSGIIAATSNNQKGIAGLATKGDNTRVDIMAIQASHIEYIDGNNESMFYDDNLIKGLYYALMHGADVVNFSLGLIKNANPAFQKVIDIAYYLDVPVVASVGNNAKITDNFYPAAYNHVIGVASCNSQRQHSDFSNVGSMVDVTAPGENIYTLDVDSDYYYCSGKGTSQAAAVTSAAVAMIKSISNNDISCDNVEYILRKTASYNGIRMNDEFGYGIINCGEAVKMAKSNKINPSYQYEIEKVIFDPIYYSDSYWDIKSAFGYNKQALYNHWVNYGRSEGRRASKAFDLGYYLGANQDLLNAFGNNYGAAFKHFITTGCYEYRRLSPVFDSGYYASYYPDLRNMTPVQLVQHFVWNGMREGRRGCETFDPKEYVWNYYDRIGAIQESISSRYDTSWEPSYMDYLMYGYYHGLSGRANFK